MSDIRSLALSRAYELVEAGKPDEARTVLEPILVNDRDNADAWWIYAHAVNDPVEARHALGNVLRVNPNYPGAAELKTALDQQYPEAPLEAVVPAVRPAAALIEEPDFVSAAPILDDEDEFPDEIEEKEERSRSWLPVFIVAGIIVVLFVVLVLILPGLTGVNNATPTAAQIAGGTPYATTAMLIETEAVTDSVTPVVPEETQAELPLLATITSETATPETEVATLEITEEAAATETEEAASPTNTRQSTRVIPEATEAATEVSGITLSATEEATEEGTAVAVVASPRPTRVTPEATEEEPETIAPTRTPRPTITPTEAEVATEVATEAATSEIPPKPEATIEPVETEATEPFETQQPLPTEEGTAETVDDYAAQITEDLQAFSIADQAFEELETSLGTTLVARVCTVEGPQLRTTLREVMDAIAGDANIIPENFAAIGARLINCDSDRTLRIIVVDRESASSYAVGALTQTEFEAEWRAQ